MSDCLNEGFLREPSPHKTIDSLASTLTPALLAPPPSSVGGSYSGRSSFSKWRRTFTTDRPCHCGHGLRFERQRSPSAWILCPRIPLDLGTVQISSRVHVPCGDECPVVHSALTPSKLRSPTRHQHTLWSASTARSEDQVGCLNVPAPAWRNSQSSWGNSL